MRSLLFVPGDSERKLAKGLETGADVLIIDLEDSVAAANKQAAREITREFLSSRRGQAGPLLYVRVNDLGTGLTDDDLAAVVAGAPAGIMLPKCNGGADVVRLSVKLRVQEADAGLDDGSIRILPIITETAVGVLAASTYGDCGTRLAGVTWGAEDLAADIGAHSNRDRDGRYTEVFRLARSLTVLAAASAGVAAIDTVYPNFRDSEGFRSECHEAERDGFTGRMAIHPSQVAIINEVFTPSASSIQESRMIVSAFEAAGNPGVVAIDGAMYDRPHLRRAERILARAGTAANA